MLLGIHPMLVGQLLLHLDSMGHGDAVAVVDAHFPARRLASRTLDLPSVGSPDALRAIRTVLPPDAEDPLDLMQTADGSRLPVMDELVEAAGLPAGDPERLLERSDFYAVAEKAYVVVRTGETRVYGNAVLRKGVVTQAERS